MKLLPLACFAATAAQSGDYNYGEVGDEESERYAFDNYDDYGNKKNKNKNKHKHYDAGHSHGYDDHHHHGYDDHGYDDHTGYGDHHHHGHHHHFSYGSKAVPGTGVTAIALNCWPANFDFDKLMNQDTTESNPSEHHFFGPLHLYGSEMHSRYATLGGVPAEFASEDPGLRASLGGHYHYGHAHHDSTHNTAPSEWVHYHSARHAGCLYEIPDFSYNANSWNRIWHLWYFNGYYDVATNGGGAITPANLDTVVYDPNWVHFFNAHVLTGGIAPVTSIDPTVTTYSDTNSIRLVIANPQYQGLGWLNFVATYSKSDTPVGSAYTEFADSTHVTTKGDLFAAGFTSYRAINNASNTQQTQGTTGNYYFDAWMGTWQLRMDDAETWTTAYTETASAGTTFAPVSAKSGSGIAISSFPHNELGKDFRFNLRILLQDSTNSNRMMYYWYKVNSVTITFPHYVAYALVHDGRETVQNGNIHDGGITISGTNANAHGEGLVDVGQNDTRDNIIPPLDLGSWYDYSFGDHIPKTDRHHRIQGYLSTVDADVCDTGELDCADFCITPSNKATTILDTTNAAQHLEEICSKKFHITGLLNTYSERLGGQRGTYQEYWIQLQYAFAISSLNTASNNLGATPDIISSPFPYLHFMAYQITDISIGCDITNVDNGNTCNAFAEYGTHDFGWGGR